MKRQKLTLCLIVGCGLILLFLANSSEEGGLTGTKSTKPVYQNQDRNGSCWKTEDCLAKLLCEGATKDTAGKCTFVCQKDADCGNGALCRAGACQKDCSELGEKCSDRRVCCFYDDDGDDVNDAECEPPKEGGDPRCLLPTSPPSPPPATLR